MTIYATEQQSAASELLQLEPYDYPPPISRSNPNKFTTSPVFALLYILAIRLRLSRDMRLTQHALSKCVAQI